MTHIPEQFAYFIGPEDAVRFADKTANIEDRLIKSLLIGEADDHFPYARRVSDEELTYLQDDYTHDRIQKAVREGIANGRRLRDNDAGILDVAETRFERITGHYQGQRLGRPVTIPMITFPGALIGENDTLKLPVLSYNNLKLKGEFSEILERVARGAWVAASYLRSHDEWTRNPFTEG